VATSNTHELWPNGVPGLDAATPSFAPTLVSFPRTDGTVRGAVIVCPGGGYGGRAAHEADPIALYYHQQGFAAFVCHYRVAPYRHPYPSLDARRAVRTVRARAAEWGVKPDKIAILGFSAGGHLASTVATHPELPPAVDDAIERVSSRPDAAILCYPVISFGPHGHEGSARNLLGDQLNDATRKEFSNELRVTAETPPCFLWHTADDGGVPVENSLQFALAMRQQQLPFALHIYPHGRHGLGLAPDDPQVSQWAPESAAWLRSLGF